MSQLDLDLRGDPGSPPGRPPRPEGPVAAPDDDPTAPSPLPESALTPTIRGQERLEQALRARLGPKVMVQLTQNRTTMVSFRRRRGVLYARLHALFAHATEPVLDAIAEFLSHPEPTEAATRRLDAFLDRHRDLVDQNRVERLVPQPEGRHHDLQRLFDTLNAEYFGGRITARITWTKAARGKRLTMRLGSYSEEENLIRIHPALDRAFVPEYFVASVVFHEMLHELHGAEELGDGRRQVHSPAFLEDERRFADYIRAKRWEQKHIRRLLRY